MCMCPRMMRLVVPASEWMCGEVLPITDHDNDHDEAMLELGKANTRAAFSGRCTE